ncbi:MAG: glycosyltransferase family 4 protein [bacterium]
MKIALIGQKGIPAKQGGVEKHVQELSTRLAQAGFDVTAYCRPHYTGEKKKNYKKVKIVNLPSINTKHLDAISHTFLATIHSLFQNYDIIHYHGVGPSLLSWIPRLLNPKTKVIVTFHSVDRKQQKWGLFARVMLTVGEWTACHFPHETITISQTLQKYCLFKFDTETIYIPNGVQISNQKKKKAILEQYGLEPKKYFLVASRLVKHKGIQTLIKAYQKIKTDKKLVIVGGGSNTGNFTEELKNLARPTSNIVFTGEQVGLELETLFRNAYLFVQPSEAEGLSIALLEAMSYGLPVIVSDIEENLEAMDGHGLSFKNKNVNDLSRQLNFAIKHPIIISKNAKLAKRQTDKKYNWDDIVSRTIGLYEQTIISDKQLVLQKAK